MKVIEFVSIVSDGFFILALNGATHHKLAIKHPSYYFDVNALHYQGAE